MHEVCQHHTGMIADISSVRREIDDLKGIIKESTKNLNDISLKLNKICLSLQRLEDLFAEKESESKELINKIEELEKFKDSFIGAINTMKWLISIGGGAGIVSFLLQFMHYLK